MKKTVTLQTTWNELPVAVQNRLKSLDRRIAAAKGPDELAEFVGKISIFQGCVVFWALFFLLFFSGKNLCHILEILFIF